MISPQKHTVKGEQIVEYNIDNLGKNSENEEPSTPKPKMLSKEPPSHIILNHPKENLLGDLDEGKRFRNRVVNQVSYMCYLSQIKSKKVEEPLNDDSCMNAMYDELHQFPRNEVWTLVRRPAEHNVIGTKWIFKNKYNENDTMERNKVILCTRLHPSRKHRF